jgi:hypothetical protein
MIGFPFVFGPKLSDFPPAITVYAGQFSGGDKPHSRQAKVRKSFDIAKHM